MPTSCGRGPYARIVSLEPHPDQSALPKEHFSRKPPSEVLYLLHFDYNFAAIPASNGPIYMRAGTPAAIITFGMALSISLELDVTDLPGYW